MSDLSCNRSTFSAPPSSSISNDTRKNTRASRRKHFTTSSLSLCRKRNVELWRRDQRAAAKDVSTAYTAANAPITKELSASIITNNLPRFSAPLTASLPFTSDAFNLFPQHGRCRRSSQSYSTYDPTNITTHNHIDQPPSSEDLDALRSTAFWELQRSVEENGEGFVRKMRDWEDVRQSENGGPRRSRKRPQSMMSRRKSSMIGTDDDDEVMIFSGETPRGDDAQSWGPPRKKRALSAGVMDFESLNTSTEDSERCSSPVDPRGSTPSVFASDDDNDSWSVAWGHTGSTTSIATNPSSSPMSWSYSSDASMNSLMHPPSDTSRKALNLPSSASRSEKALAALTLALANGAGGLTDYEPLLALKDDSSSIGNYHVGELWD